MNEPVTEQIPMSTLADAAETRTLRDKCRRLEQEVEERSEDQQRLDLELATARENVEEFATRCEQLRGQHTAACLRESDLTARHIRLQEQLLESQALADGHLKQWAEERRKREASNAERLALGNDWEANDNVRQALREAGIEGNDPAAGVRELVGQRDGACAALFDQVQRVADLRGAQLSLRQAAEVALEALDHSPYEAQQEAHDVLSEELYPTAAAPPAPPEEPAPEPRDPPCMYCDGHGVTGPLDENATPTVCEVCIGSGFEPAIHSLLGELAAVSDSWMGSDYEGDVVEDIREIVGRYRAPRPPVPAPEEPAPEPLPEGLWQWTHEPECYEMRRTNGQSAATVWTNGRWHTWDTSGIGGENSSAPTVADAKDEALAAVVRQGWADTPEACSHCDGSRYEPVPAPEPERAEPAEPVGRDVPPLPDGWVWVETCTPGETRAMATPSGYPTVFACQGKLTVIAPPWRTFELPVEVVHAVLGRDIDRAAIEEHERKVRAAIAAEIRRKHPPRSWPYLEEMADKIEAGTFGRLA